MLKVIQRDLVVVAARKRNYIQITEKTLFLKIGIFLHDRYKSCNLQNYYSSYDIPDIISLFQKTRKMGK